MRVPITRAARTDPTLYEWDRLTPDQQQAVLDTIKGAKGYGRRSRGRPLVLGTLVILLLAALVTAFLLSRGLL